MRTGIAVWIAVLAIGANGADPASPPKWRSLGPDGGWISALVIDRQNASTIYAGTRGNGVFKTTDGGASWSPVNAGLSHSWVFALVMDPQNTNTLYVSLDSGSLASAVFKTTDGGGSWFPARSGLPDDIFGVLAVDPQHSGTVYAASGWDASFAADRSALYKTTDGGASWTPASTGLPIDQCWVGYVVIDPQSANTVYAACGGFPDNGGLFKSTDGGASWRPTGFPAPYSPEILAIDPKDSNILYAGVPSAAFAYPGALGGIWKSTDGGSTWAAASSGLPASSTRTLGLTLDPQSPGTVYAVMVDRTASIPWPSGRCCGQPGSVFKSTDGGSSWSEIKSGLSGVTFDPMDACSCPSSYIGLAVDPHNSDTVYLGTNGDGVYKSMDGGQSWFAVSSGLRAVTATQIVIDPRNSAALFATTGDRIFKTGNSGVRWIAGPWGIPDVSADALTIDPQAPDTMYMGSLEFEDGHWAHVYKTIDGGASWHDTNFNHGLGWGIKTLAIDPFDRRRVYTATSNNLYMTSDGGETWVALPLSSAGAYAIAIDPKHPGTVYAGTFASPGGYFTIAVYKSTDGGTTWNAASAGLPPETLSLLMIDPQNTNTVYAGSKLGIYKSTDGGATWSVSNTGLRFAGRGIRSLVIDPRNPNVLYAATDQGVFQSLDGGTNWTEVGSASKPDSISSLAIGSDTLYAAGRGGVFVIVLGSQPTRRGR